MSKQVPPEIIQTILSHSRPWNLPTLSLVCRLWQSLAFPFLYRTIFLDRYWYATLLVDRINAEAKDAPLQITHCARNLVINLEAPESLFDKSEGSQLQLDLGRFSLAVTKLLNIEKLTFGPTWLSADLEVLMPTLNLPKLKCLNLKVHPLGKNRRTISNIFSFKNLRHISVEIAESLPGKEPSESVILLTAMIRASPELESLSLDFPSTGLERDFGGRSQVEDLFSQLSEVVFPRLHALKVVSRFVSPTSPALRQFLRGHPGLNTLAFGPMYESISRVIGVDEIAAIAPAVQYFEGPAHQVTPLLESNISAQIKSLTIYENLFRDNEFGPVMQDFSRTHLPKLSSLRTLRIRTKISLKRLTHILEAAPELEELEFSGHIKRMYNASEYSQTLLQTLSLTPCLRVLTVVKSDDEISKVYDPRHMLHFLDRVTTICPQLDTIHHMEHERWAGTWRLKDLGNNPEVRTYTYGEADRSLFPSLALGFVKRQRMPGPWSRLHAIA
ncbi:hypothetical protein FRC12_000883 [Ceratobasidium sp. 428]|nr:hypothetical protein FRC12_000883 [Ceratobasidium sp. 428]